MDRSSYFIKDRAMFGSFPTQEAVEELEEEGVRFFINLTHDDEKKITPYTTKYTQILFPIIDRQVPKDSSTNCLWCDFVIDPRCESRNRKSMLNS